LTEALELTEILNAMGFEADHPATGPIQREDVRRWMDAPDIEAQGALLDLLMNRSHYLRIDPPLSFEDYHIFVMRYYERCFREDPDGEWSDTRYTAGWGLVNWFKGLWFDSNVPRSALGELKDWLARLYREGDEDVRTCLVTATLEHLFEERDIARFFADWKDDDVLRTAFEEAMDWQRSEGGHG
jgi:hypothetical protein